jgi:hypothetical protein
MRRAPATTDELNRIVRGAGLVILLSYVVLVPLSYAIAAVAPYGIRQPREIAAFNALVHAAWIPSLPVSAFLERVLSGDSIFAVRWVRAATCVALLSVASLGAILATVGIRRSRHLVSGSTVTLIGRMAIGLALVNVLVYPMFTQDMWMSVVWGRMLQSGHNPYYEYYTAGALAGTPLADIPLRMTYGPLWAWVSVAAASVSWGNPVAAFFVSKLLLAGFWLLGFWLIRAMLADTDPARQASALCFFGWWPASVHFAVAEGHNDIAMVSLVLLWMYLTVGKRQWLSVVPLVASVLIKYVSAPLIAVELWRGWRANRRSPLAFAIAAAGSVIGGLLVIIPLWRDRHFLDAVLGMQSWDFLTLAQAASMVLTRIGVPLTVGVATQTMRGLFAVSIVYCGTAYVRNPDRDRLASLVLALMSGVLFSGVGHVWPWFLIWVMAPAALAGSGLLWRLAVCAALAAPFMDLFWLATNGWEALPRTGLVFFGAIGLLAVLPVWNGLAWGRVDRSVD